MLANPTFGLQLLKCDGNVVNILGATRDIRTERKKTSALHITGSIYFLAALCVATYIQGASWESVIRRFTQLSFDDLQTWKRNHWLGIRTLQNPNDVWIIQEIIFDVKPDLIFERALSMVEAPFFGQ